MKLLTLGLAIVLSLVLLGSAGPVVQANSDNSSDNATVGLEVEVVPPPPPRRGGGGGAPIYYIKTNLFDVVKRYRISYSGKLRETIEATSEDGMLTITIPKGTIALDKDGKRLKILELAVDESPPDPPEHAHIIGLAYDLGPERATFDPGITLVWSYDPDTLPEGVAEGYLVIACYDEDAAEWGDLDCVVDIENDTVSACVEHLTTFAIIGIVPPPPPPAPAAFTISLLSISPAEVTLDETVTISLLVTNTGGKRGSYTVTLKINGVREADKRVTVAAGDGETVTFSVTGKEPGSYAVDVDRLSGSFTVAPAPGEFLVTNLSIRPLEVQPDDTVTITVAVTNTHRTSGVYSLVLEINGVKEAEKQVSLGAGSIEAVSFSVTREEAGSYSVFINGLSGSFTVLAPVVPPPPGINWLLVGGIIAAAVVVVALVLFLLIVRRRAT